MGKLKALLDEYHPTGELTAQVEYSSGFKLEVTYWPDAKLQKELDKTKRTKWVRHQKTEEYSDTAFSARLVKAVQGWEGCNYEVLAQMGVLDLGKLFAAKRKETEAKGLQFGDKEKKALAQTEIPFSEDDLLDLFTANSAFEKFVADAVCDPAIFPLDEERGN